MDTKAEANKTTVTTPQKRKTRKKGRKTAQGTISIRRTLRRTREAAGEQEDYIALSCLDASSQPSLL